VVGRPAANAVGSNHVLETRLPKRHAVEDRFGEEQRWIRFGARAVPHAAMFARQVKMTRLGFRDAPPVNPGDIARRVEDRHGHAPAKMFLPPAIQHAQRFQPFNEFTAFGQHRVQRAVAIADLEHIQHCRVRQIAPLQILQAVPVLVQRPRVKAHHALKQRGRILRRGLRGRALRAGGRAQAPAGLLDQPINRLLLREAVFLHHEINHAARRPAAKAVKEILARRDMERSRLLGMERTQAHIIVALLLELHAPRRLTAAFLF
jgi:hypothetical protein